ETEAETRRNRERAEFEHLDRAVEAADLAIAQDSRRRARPDQPIAEAKLVEQGDHPAIGLEEVVIELVEPARTDLEAGGEPAWLRLALEHRHAGAAYRQPARPDHPERPRPDHRHVRHRAACLPCPSLSRALPPP